MIDTNGEKMLDIKPGTLVQYYDKIAMIIREANMDDIVSTYGNRLEKDQIWTFTSGIIKYSIILLEDEMYICNQDNLKPFID